MVEPEWTSPLLGVRFVQEWQELLIYYPSGEPFTTEQSERAGRRYAERQAAVERRRAEAEGMQRELYAAKPRELGIDPDSLQLP